MLLNTLREVNRLIAGMVKLFKKHYASQYITDIGPALHNQEQWKNSLFGIIYLLKMNQEADLEPKLQLSSPISVEEIQIS